MFITQLLNPKGEVVFSWRMAEGAVGYGGRYGGGLHIYWGTAEGYMFTGVTPPAAS